MIPKRKQRRLRVITLQGVKENKRNVNIAKLENVQWDSTQNSLLSFWMD